MEHSADPAIAQFFKDYERTIAAGDAKGLVKFYAASFLSAGPDGAKVVNSRDLLRAIPKRKQLLQVINCRSSTLISLAETRLDDCYSMVRTEWQWTFEQGDRPRPELILIATFVVHRSREGLRIVFYMTRDDIVSVLRERGLLPALKAGRT